MKRNLCFQPAAGDLLRACKSASVKSKSHRLKRPLGSLLSLMALFVLVFSSSVFGQKVPQSEMEKNLAIVASTSSTGRFGPALTWLNDGLVPSENFRGGRNRVMPRMGGASYLGSEFDPSSATYRLKFMRGASVIWVDVDAKTASILRIKR